MAAERRLEIGPAENELTLPGGVRQLSIPVRLERSPSEAMTLVVELQCDDQQPQNSVVSLTRIRQRDALLGLNRRDPSLERSWSGQDRDLPPAWTQQLLVKHCRAALPPAWNTP
tara:strand:+ start:1437 stop:1778 length:342 start_codon:yes stop_codon:yes gene_type:complete